MKEQDFIDSSLLGKAVLSLITTHSSFKDELKDIAPSIAAEIESASVNHNCSCISKVTAFVTLNAAVVGSLIYNFANKNDILQQVQELFVVVPEPVMQSVSGKVAKTTIKNWPEFVSSIRSANYGFEHISTSIVGDDVYVFFL